MPRETTPRVRSRLKIRFISKCSQQAGKPNSVSLDSALSRLARDDDHSSRPVIADRLQQPTRKRRTGRPVRLSPGASLFGLAPCGVLPATGVTTGAVRSYRTFSPLPSFALDASSLVLRRASPVSVESDRGLPAVVRAIDPS